MFRMIFFVVGEVMVQSPEPWLIYRGSLAEVAGNLWLAVIHLALGLLRAEMHAFWATHFFLGFFLIYTGYKARFVATRGQTEQLAV